MALTGVITAFLFLSDAALVFSGNINPAHPNSIGCIDSMCDVTEVTRGKKIEDGLLMGLKSAGILFFLMYPSNHPSILTSKPKKVGKTV